MDGLVSNPEDTQAGGIPDDATYQYETGQPGHPAPSITIMGTADAMGAEMPRDVALGIQELQAQMKLEQRFMVLNEKIEHIGQNVSKIRDELNAEREPTVVPYDLIDEATRTLVWMRAGKEQQEQARNDVCDSISALGFTVEIVPDYDSDVPF